MRWPPGQTPRAIRSEPTHRLHLTGADRRAAAIHRACGATGRRSAQAWSITSSGGGDSIAPAFFPNPWRPRLSRVAQVTSSALAVAEPLCAWCRRRGLAALDAVVDLVPCAHLGCSDPAVQRSSTRIGSLHLMATYMISSPVSWPPRGL